MDYAPLNLAHFHERRSEKFLKKHRYDDAYKAVQTSLLYLQDALKTVEVDKSIDVLTTQKWDYERKLRQILMQKQQYERLKLKEIVPIPESSLLKPIDINLSGHSIAKSIDQTVEKFDCKTFLGNQAQNIENGKECKVTVYPCNALDSSGSTVSAMSSTASLAKSEANGSLLPTISSLKIDCIINEDLDLPSLAPLELPSFDMSFFTSSSAPSLVSFNFMAENFQK